MVKVELLLLPSNVDLLGLCGPRRVLPSSQATRIFTVISHLWISDILLVRGAAVGKYPFHHLDEITLELIFS